VRRVLLPACLLLLFTPTADAQRAETYAARRARLLGELKRCEDPGPPYDCDDTSVDRVGDLYKRGDASVLPKLMDVAPKSDGALSEALGSFFSDLLCGRPETFLRAVAARPRREHDNLLFLAAAADGGGMGCRNMAGLRRRLNGLSRSRNRRLAAVALKSLEQVNKYNPER
jgi:hypothetical protein